MEDITLIHLDTCLPDYFNGFDGHVYAIPLHAGMTYAEVFEELKEAIDQEEIYGFEGNYTVIENACEGMRYYAKERGLLSAEFCPGINDNDYADTVYAYFGVKLPK